jgi:hypothetical protein
MEMEYGKAFTYPQQDSNWVLKWGIAGAVSLIPVVGQLLVAGYGVEVSRRVIAGDPQPLPEWSDWAGFLRKGFGVLVIGLVYLLPLIVLAVCAAVPAAVISVIQSNSGSSPDWMGQAGGIVGACLGCFGAVYGLVAGLMLQAAIGRYAATDQIGAALRVGEIWNLMRAKPGMFLIVILLAGLAQFLLTSLGSIACVIGAVWGGAYAALITAHLIGQAYRYVTAQSAAQ